VPLVREPKARLEKRIPLPNPLILTLPLPLLFHVSLSVKERFPSEINKPHQLAGPLTHSLWEELSRELTRHCHEVNDKALGIRLAIRASEHRVLRHGQRIK
jgi:hypothetical protein